MSQALLVLLGTTMVMAMDGCVRMVVNMCGGDQSCWDASRWWSTYQGEWWSCCHGCHGCHGDGGSGGHGDGGGGGHGDGGGGGGDDGGGGGVFVVMVVVV